MITNNQRRKFLINTTALGIGVVCSCAFSEASDKTISEVTSDENTETKTTFHYQDHPSGSLRCGQCIFFVPLQPNSLAGSCRVIDGNVIANGWCTAYRPKDTK